VTALFYISGHGFGHASREVEVINALRALQPGVRVLVRTAVSPDLLRRTLRRAVDLRPGPCDTGVVQSTSVAHDAEATSAHALAFHADLDRTADREARALEPDAISVVIGDIPPLAFEVAARLDVPSLAIANFTWDWIYEDYPALTADESFLPRLRAAYGRATRALRPPFSAGFEVFSTVEDIPLIARRPTRERDETRAWFNVPADRPAVLLSFGGYGLPNLDLGGLDCLREWTIVTTDRVTPAQGAAHPAIVFIDERRFEGGAIRYEDLVAAVDVVLTKPGYGIIGECIAAGTAMLYTSRGAFREYDLLVNAMPAYLRTRFLSQDDLFAGRWRSALDSVRTAPPPPLTMRVDGAEVAARAILSFTETRNDAHA
jgi:L-arabinokinase